MCILIRMPKKCASGVVAPYELDSEAEAFDGHDRVSAREQIEMSGFLCPYHVD
jgi:hypothetical protein